MAWFWVTTLTWRKQQRLYFGLGVKDALAAQNALTWFLKIEPLNTTLPNDKSTELARSSLSNFSPRYLTADECGSLFLLVGIWYPRPRERQARVNMCAQGQQCIKETERRRSPPDNAVTLQHSLFLSPSYFCTNSQCFHTKSIGAL